MQPRTKIEKRLDLVVQTLDYELTDHQFEYMKDNCFVNEVTESRGRFYCSYCGHTWKTKDPNVAAMAHCTCPNCQRYSQVKHKAASNKIYDYFAVSRKLDNEWQMFKYYQVKRYMCRGEIRYVTGMIAVVFLSNAGKIVKFMVNRNMSHYWFDTWSLGGKVTLKRDTYGIMEKIAIGAIVTEDMTPMLQRNGWDGNVCGYNAHYLCHELLTDSNIESLYKQGHTAVVRDRLNVGYSAFDILPLLNIASRHGVKFDNWEHWLDFKDYIKDLKYLEKDIRNPSIIFPQDFQAAHELWHKRAEKKREQIRAEQARQRALEAAERDKKKKAWMQKYARLFGTMLIEKRGYQITALTNAKMLAEEGAAMHHCVSTYYGKLDTLLLSIKKDGKRMETAEIDLKSNNIVQCRGLQNKPSESHDEIVSILKECLWLFAQYYEGKKKAKAKQAEPQPMTQALVKIA